MCATERTRKLKKKKNVRKLTRSMPSAKRVEPLVTKGQQHEPIQEGHRLPQVITML